MLRKITDHFAHPMVALAIWVLPNLLIAQIEQGGRPMALSTALSVRGVPIASPTPFDPSMVPDQSTDRSTGPVVPFDALRLEMNVDVTTTGRWDVLKDGSRVCRLRVSSPGAYGLELFFADVDLPVGTSMFVHGGDGERILGAFTRASIHADGTFATDRTRGDACLVEIDVPSWAQDANPHVRIASVGHTYRPYDVAADPCEVDVVCSPEGDDWMDESDGVVRIRVVENGQIGYCSGSLINNVEQDCTPYILTAFHCGVGASSSDFPLWKFYFRYQRAQCGSGNAYANKVMTGCTERANSNDGGGQNGSDFLLVELMDEVPGSYGPYWNGWDATGTISGSGVGIHHPNGDEKKISTYTTNLVTTHYSWNGPQSHWLVHWSGTPNGHGVTEGGSSGSPLFDASGHIIGKLTGGSSYCNSVVPGGENQPDYYGKLSYDWTNNPNTSAQKLKAWLDPQSSGTLVLDGSRDPCGIYVGVAERPQALDAAVWTPTPANDRAWIRIPSALTAPERVDLIDPTGRVVPVPSSVLNGTVELELSGVAQGYYAVRTWTKGAPASAGRLIVQR
ncbi:MAG: hypothetical protein H6597_08095 [Flavobacteriales bacterium]|nr:hypothetical protein [Flavobacteriales bacterium]MCB9194475.1 hypothetical protein [Flavobacteriales bacterium]